MGGEVFLDNVLHRSRDHARLFILFDLIERNPEEGIGEVCVVIVLNGEGNPVFILNGLAVKCEFLRRYALSGCM